MRFGARVIAAALISISAGAQESGHIAPLPMLVEEQAPTRITPPDSEKAAADILSTKPVPAAVPFGTASKPAANSYLPDKVPFGRATPTGPVVPSAPHDVVATPVEGVDAVEVSEPAPPTPVAPEADPAATDPATPTELTSPIFDGAEDSGAPRKIVIRVLNKVTAQATVFKSAPKEMVKFGRLEITTAMCRNSSPNSQPDHAGLLDISEKLPDKAERKRLFRGWMYASSPSIAALEHPIYDVTMVDCEIVQAAPKPEKKPEPAPAKKGKK